MTLDPGVHNSTSGILIDGPVPVTLDGGGDPSAVFIFQAASSGNLIVETTSSIIYTNGAQPCNVFWKVNSAFLRNTGHTFIGTILALTQITLTEDINVEGRLLARNADVTFIHDTVTRPICAPAVTPGDTSSTPTSTTSTTATTSTTPPVIAPAPAARPRATPTRRATPARRATPTRSSGTGVPAQPRPPVRSFGLTG
jgi:type VI secretion system secreted protein VgrG